MDSASRLIDSLNGLYDRMYEDMGPSERAMFRGSILNVLNSVTVPCRTRLGIEEGPMHEARHVHRGKPIVRDRDVM